MTTKGQDKYELQSLPVGEAVEIPYKANPVARYANTISPNKEFKSFQKRNEFFVKRVA